MLQGFTQSRCLTLAQRLAAEHIHRLGRFHIGRMPGQAHHIHNFQRGAGEYQLHRAIAFMHMQGSVGVVGRTHMQLDVFILHLRQLKLTALIRGSTDFGTHHLNRRPRNRHPRRVTHHTFNLR